MWHRASRAEAALERCSAAVLVSLRLEKGVTTLF